MTWQRALASEVAAVVGVPCQVHGSVATGADDAASDLDLVAIAPDLTPWHQLQALDPLGPRWAHQSAVGDHWVLHRVVFDDGRFLDLKFVDDRADLPEGAVPVPPANTEPPSLVSGTSRVDDRVTHARFLAAQASMKAARNDLLIAGHLTLDLARSVLERAMLLRDRDLGTTVHRFGGPFNEIWDEVAATLAVRDSSSGPGSFANARALLSTIHRLTHLDEHLAAKLWPEHQPSLVPLELLQARVSAVMPDPARPSLRP